MNFKDMNLTPVFDKTTIKVGDVQLEVNSHLPAERKVAFIGYVVDHALNENTGRFSPFSVGLFFDLAIAHYYGGIDFEDDVRAFDAYDALDTTGAIDAIVNAIPKEEYEEITNLVNETVTDIADYNSSFAGILQIANTEASGLDNQLTEILDKIKNREGLELLDQIKNVVGSD